MGQLVAISVTHTDRFRPEIDFLWPLFLLINFGYEAILMSKKTRLMTIVSIRALG